MLRIAGATLNQTPLDWDGNTARILQAITTAREQNVDILCFQELCISGYGCEDLHLSDWLSERSWQELEKISQFCDDEMIVCLGLPLRIRELTFNGVCVIRNKQLIGITLKQNLARDGVHYEPRWFEPWTPGLVEQIDRSGSKVNVGDLVYEAKGIRFGFEICEDAWRQERPGKRLHDREVDLIINPSASHFALGKSDSRETLVVDSSRMFSCAYIYVNVLGNEAGRMIYDGDIIIAQKGKLLKTNRRLSFKEVEVLTWEVDFAGEKSPFATTEDFKMRNEEFAQAASLGLFDYLRKSHARGFVLSLSGGADSSLCAVLVAEMVRRGAAQLGWDEFSSKLGLKRTNDQREAVRQLLHCAYQGTENSSATTRKAATDLANSIGAEFSEWTIEDEVGSYTRKVEKALGRKLSWHSDDIALQNIQARARSPIIWMLANVRQSILITTSNRSEGDVGYATMDGDTSGSLAPIAGIDKPFIIQWLRWAEAKLGYSGLQLVNTLPPTAELRPKAQEQTDEKDLMPYEILVKIERLAILMRLSPLQVHQNLSGEYRDPELKNHIKKFFQRWAANQWKRERLAPSFHLDDLNVDPRSWCRFPILSANFKFELDQLDRMSNHDGKRMR
jgi:NAD+ synthase (glutamine-hydrolysing)